MNTARQFPAAATGPDGRIYVFGGQTSSANLNTVEVYTPNTNKWTFVAPMPTARNSAAATIGPNGRLFVIGGSTMFNSFAGATNIVESYNPNTNTWSTEVPLATARAGLAAVLGYDGRPYAFGGGTSTAVPLATNERYQAVSGFAAPAASKSPIAGTVDLGSTSTLTPASATVPLQSAGTSQWLVSSSNTSADITPREGTDAVFAAGDSLFADSTDDLFSGGVS